MKKLLFLLSGIAAMSAVLVGTVGPTSGADHGDAPLAKANHPEDLADVYAFAGGGSGTVVLAITVIRRRSTAPASTSSASTTTAMRSLTSPTT